LSGGTIANPAGLAVYSGAAGAGVSVINTGIISNAGTRSVIGLHDGGWVSNTAGGAIDGAAGNAVYFTGAPGTVFNAGTILSQGPVHGVGIVLEAGGYVSNAASGVIAPEFHSAISGLGVAIIVRNAGRIGGSPSATTGVYLTGGAYISNASGGTIAGGKGGNAVYAKLVGATLVNAGTMTVAANGYDVVGMHFGGAVSNLAGGVMTGAAPEPAVYFGGAPGMVTNAGTIQATGTAGSAVSMRDGGTVTNLAGGLLAASGTAASVAIGGAPGTVINAGTIEGGNGVAISFGGSYADRVVVDPGAVFIGTVNGGTAASTLELASAASADTLTGLGIQIVNFGSIAFDTSADWFIAGNTTGLSGTISGFARGDTIELTGIAVTGSSYAGGILTLAEVSGSATLALTGSFTAASDFVVTNVAGGADVGIACFRAGTFIRTARGDVKVEELQVGDEVATKLRGSSAPIVWIGHRTVKCTRHPNPRRVRPVRIAAGAFGPGRPSRDLFLSPDHAIHVDDVLIPAKHLINGTSIVQGSASV